MKILGNEQMHWKHGHYPLKTSVSLNSPLKTTKNIKHVQSKSLPRVKVYLSAVESQKTLFFSLSPSSFLLGVIQRSNKIIMDDRHPIFGRQSVSMPNLFDAEDIVHYLPNFVATWNPPFKQGFKTRKKYKS